MVGSFASGKRGDYFRLMLTFPQICVLLDQRAFRRAELYSRSRCYVGDYIRTTHIPSVICFMFGLRASGGQDCCLELVLWTNLGAK